MRTTRQFCITLPDEMVERWLHNQVGPAYDALKADKSRAVTAKQVRERLATERAKRR